MEPAELRKLATQASRITVRYTDDGCKSYRDTEDVLTPTALGLLLDVADALEEYIAAADQSARGDDDIADMLRFGKADETARAALAKLREAP